MADCSHPKLHPEIFDQTGGVACPDCPFHAYCWRDRHCSEALWNRAAANDPEVVPCEQNRDTHCFLCGEEMSSDAPHVGDRAPTGHQST